MWHERRDCNEILSFLRIGLPLEVGMEITVRGALYNFITERIGEDDVVLEPSEYIF